MNLERRPLKTLDEGHVPFDKPLLPGESEFLSKKELGRRAFKQKTRRTGDWTVVISNGIHEKTVVVPNVSSKGAAVKAALKGRNKLFKAIKVISPIEDIRPWKRKQ